MRRGMVRSRCSALVRQRRANLEVSGNLHKKVGVFLSSQTNRTRRYLDPPEIGSLHNAGGAAQLLRASTLHRPSMTLCT